MFDFLKKKKSVITAADTKVGKLIYLMNYKEHYGEVFKEVPSKEQFLTPRILAELYVFRGWTTQYGYRIFSSNKDVSEKIIDLVVNSSEFLGLPIFKDREGISVEEELGDKYINIIEERWRKYDLLVIKHSEGLAPPTRMIIGELTTYAGVKDLNVFMALSLDFIEHLKEIQKDASEIGLL